VLKTLSAQTERTGFTLGIGKECQEQTYVEVLREEGRQLPPQNVAFSGGLPLEHLLRQQLPHCPPPHSWTPSCPSHWPLLVAFP